MKINLLNRRDGSALIYTLIMGAVLGIGTASFLTLVNAQFKSVHRSQNWNASMAAIEAGIEEALTQIHYNDITNLASNGWTYYSSSGRYYKWRFLDNNNAVVVNISAVNPPVIDAYGYVRDPGSGNWLHPRIVEVKTLRMGMFMKGMVAKGAINLNGNNITANSFDSTDPNYSTNGRDDPTKTKDNGDVATNSGLVNSLNAGNANIYGHVSTGPGGSVAIGSNGSAGSKAWQTAGNKGIQPGWSSDDMNVSFADVIVPSGTWTTPASGTVGGTSYSMVLTNGLYKVGSVSSSVIATGNAVLWVTNSIALSGQDSITVSSNASLKVYMSGSSASLAGNGVANLTGNALQFMYYGTTNNTSLSFGGNAGFVGTIYAPSAGFSLSGGGNNTTDFIGSSVTGTITMNGHFNFHYDENLGRQGPQSGFVISSWNEL